MALETGSKARIQTRAAASLSQADPHSCTRGPSLSPSPGERCLGLIPPQPFRQTKRHQQGELSGATGIRGVLSHRREYKESGAPPQKGLRTESLKQWGAGPGMTPGHTEEGVRLRDSRPLPQCLPESLRTGDSPCQAPSGTRGKVKY